MKRRLIYLSVLSALSVTTIAVADDVAPAVTQSKAATTTTTATATPKPWAYQAVHTPAVPSVKQKKWVRTPIDAFVLSKLEEKGIKPSADADRGTYIRRATLDAWGILPTPEQVKDFEKDRSADAYEKLVDRLLASPHFGERQARRWLDLARSPFKVLSN